MSAKGRPWNAGNVHIDSDAQIAACLNCQLCDCINCHESSAKRRRQGVDQLDLDGGFIQRWPTAREAGRVLGLNPQNITNVLKGRAKTAGGFIWRYAEQC